MIRLLDSNFTICKSTTIQQAVLHFCKGDIFQDGGIIALPVGESNCDILTTKKFETSKSIINDHSKEGNLMSMKLSEKYMVHQQRQQLVMDKKKWEVIIKQALYI